MKNIPVSALIGLFFTALYFLGAILAPLLAPYGVGEVVGDVWEPASAEFLLGTDNIGRDLLTRMIYGGQTTIFIATAATVLSFTTGSILGFIAAEAGGWLDQAMSRFVDLLMTWRHFAARCRFQNTNSPDPVRGAGCWVFCRIRRLLRGQPFGELQFGKTRIKPALRHQLIMRP